MTIRIGFDATPLLGPRSGVGHYTGRLLATLLAQEPTWQYLLYSNQPLPTDAALQTATHINGHWSFSRWLWMQVKLPRLITQTAPHLCHFTNASAPFLIRKPFILTIHDASLFLYPRYHPRQRLLAIRLLLPYLARQADAIITVSHYARRDLSRALQLPANKIHVVYNAAPTTFAPITNTTTLTHLRQHYHLPEQYIFYVGTIEPRKNLIRLIRALAQLRHHFPNLHLVMAGPRGWMMHNLQQEIEKQDVQTAVHPLGYVPTHHLPGLFSLATCFVFPSLYEGFGLPTLEAMACGSPVLTSADSAMAEICGDAAYLVDPTSTTALTEGLYQLLTTPHLRQTLQTKGLQRAKQFSWQQAAAQTTAVYQQLLNTPTKPHAT